MGVLAVLCLSSVVFTFARAHGSDEWDVYKKWTAMKAMESCWGEDNMKIYTVNLKQAIAKCSQIDAPELSLPPFRSPYRFLNTMLTSAGEMEKRQVDLAVRMLELLKDDLAEDSGAATTYVRKKIFTSGPYSLTKDSTEDSLSGLVKRLAMKKEVAAFQQQQQQLPYEALTAATAGSKYPGAEEDLVERLVEERVRESMMEYKLKQSLLESAAGAAGAAAPYQTNRQRLAALMEARRYRRQAPADGVKPAPVPGGVAAAATLPESLDLGDRLAEKLKAQQERLMAHVGNFTCVLRETRVLNERNELDLDVQKRALEQYNLPSEWFKKRLVDTYETCNKVAASLPTEAVTAGEAALAPGLYRIKSFLRCCKESKLRLCMFQDVKTKLEKNFGPLEKILAQTQLTEDQLFPLVIMLLHGEEMEYF